MRKHWLVHGHNATCFKNIPRHIQSLIDPDNDCRFELPRPLVSETHFDEGGDLVIRCENGRGPRLGCNTDLKQTASGPVTMAMVEYMLSYTAKLQLDTSIVVPLSVRPSKPYEKTLSITLMVK